MNTPRWIRPLFAFAALYDGLLGAAFLVAPGRIFELAGVDLPNHLGYVQFPAALLLVFALMFLRIARDPLANRNLVIYGILLKVAYCVVSGFHWLTSGIPGMWKPFAIVDLAMGIAFLGVWRCTHAVRPEGAS
jgi:hypothetical protein